MTLFSASARLRKAQAITLYRVQFSTHNKPFRHKINDLRTVGLVYIGGVPYFAVYVKIRTGPRRIRECFIFTDTNKWFGDCSVILCEESRRRILSGISELSDKIIHGNK